MVDDDSINQLKIKERKGELKENERKGGKGK